MSKKALAASNPPYQSEPLVFQPNDKTDTGVRFYLASSLERVFPGSPAGDVSRTLTLLVPRNGTVSFQACLKNKRPWPLEVQCAVTGADGLDVQVRRVGYVPLRHLTQGTELAELDAPDNAPGLVPEPLYPEAHALVGPNECQSFWITTNAPKKASPGVRHLTVRYTFEKGAGVRELTADVDVRPLLLKPRRNFPVTTWWRAESIYQWYKTKPFDEKWWEITKPYIRDQVTHGSNMIYVPMLVARREEFPPDTYPQLLRIRTTAPDKYEFDFSDVRRFVRMAKECGADYVEWPHLWIYWGVRNPVRIYGNGPEGRSELLIPLDAPATTGTYRVFLEQFLPAFHAFLKEEKVLKMSYFHLSDEPHGEEMLQNYKRARSLLKELAPWMKVMDALSEVEYGRSGICDYPVPYITSAQAYLDEKIPHWVYYCGTPPGPCLTRCYDTPLAKIRMSGWVFYRLQTLGFLHWGYNYWHAFENQKLIDPFEEGACGAWPFIPYGEAFLVYPGENGPIDSIRWEVFAESLQDYAILQTVGINPDDPMLAQIKNYADFPKNAEWIESTVRHVLTERAQ